MDDNGSKIPAQSKEAKIKENESFQKITGFKNSEVSIDLIGQLSNFHLQSKADGVASFNLAVNSLMEFAPKDGIEGMLSAQMLATHSLAMELLKRALAAEYLDEADRYVNSAAKLMRTFTAQTEALNSHRGKGPAKIQVENVNVSDGGQAIVGNISTGGTGPM